MCLCVSYNYEYSDLLKLQPYLFILSPATTRIDSTFQEAGRVLQTVWKVDSNTNPTLISESLELTWNSKMCYICSEFRFYSLAIFRLQRPDWDDNRTDEVTSKLINQWQQLGSAVYLITPESRGELFSCHFTKCVFTLVRYFNLFSFYGTDITLSTTDRKIFTLKAHHAMIQKAGRAMFDRIMNILKVVPVTWFNTDYLIHIRFWINVFHGNNDVIFSVRPIHSRKHEMY